MITNDTIVILMPKLRISVEILDFVIQVIFLKIWFFLETIKLIQTALEEQKISMCT